MPLFSMDSNIFHKCISKQIFAHKVSKIRHVYIELASQALKYTRMWILLRWRRISQRLLNLLEKLQTMRHTDVCTKHLTEIGNSFCCCCCCYLRCICCLLLLSHKLPTNWRAIAHNAKEWKSHGVAAVNSCKWIIIVFSFCVLSEVVL